MCIEEQSFLDQPMFIELIKDYVADPAYRYAPEELGPVAKVEVSHAADSKPGWKVAYFCQGQPGRSFHEDVSPEQLFGWMWAQQKKSQTK